MISVLKPTKTGTEYEAVKSVIDSGWWAMGSKVEELEERWADFTGAKYAVATNSCTAALDIACRVVDLPKTVTVSSFTFVSSALAPLNAGREVEFVDIDEESFCSRKADIQVMYAGNQFGEGTIYDMAHSGGEKHRGLVSCWSFHALKNLPAGDGGMLTTDSEEIYRRAKSISWCGIDKSTWRRSGKKYSWDYDIQERGLKANMNDITASIALEQLNVLKKNNEYRSRIASLYDRELPDWIKRPFRSSTWHLYTVRIPRRDELFDFLASKGIGCGVHYKPLYNYPIFKNKKLPITEKVFHEIISLPLHCGITDGDVEYICGSINEFYGHNIQRKS